MPRTPMPRPPYGSSEVYIRRGTFRLLAIHWALIIAAAPFIVFIQSRPLFGWFIVFAFLSTVILWWTTPARFIDGSHVQTVHPALIRFHAVLTLLCIAFGICLGGFMIILRDGGPGIQEGVFCVESHGRFVRAITESEYIRLSRAERALFCSVIACIRSGLMAAWCHVNRIV